MQNKFIWQAIRDSDFDEISDLQGIWWSLLVAFHKITFMTFGGHLEFQIQNCIYPGNEILAATLNFDGN